MGTLDKLLIDLHLSMWFPLFSLNYLAAQIQNIQFLSEILSDTPIILVDW